MSARAIHYLTMLEKVPKTRRSLTNSSWADYIELVCLANLDEELSEKDVSDRLAGRVKDFKEGDEEDAEEIENLELEPDDGSEPSRRAEVSDKWDIKTADYFRILYARQELYREHYPFVIEDDYIRKKPKLTEHHLLYVYLVLCANLYLFDKPTGSALANSFELISFNAFRSILPPNAIVHLFGKNPFNVRGRYSNETFWKRLNKLKKDINEKLNSHLTRDEFSERHTGDEGLDLVGWVPTGDKLSSGFVHFAQCACTYNFVEKQHSSSTAAWSQIITFKSLPSNSTFIPHCFRGANGDWVSSRDIKYTFLIDRKRIIHYYSNSRKIKFTTLEVYNLVEEIIRLKEGVV